MNRLPNHKEASWAIRELIDDSVCHLQLLLLFTALSCSDKNFTFTKSQQELAKLMRTSHSTVKRKLPLLIKKQYLTVLSKGSNLLNVSTKYRLNVNKILSTLSTKTYQSIMKSKGDEWQNTDKKTIKGGFTQNPGVGSERAKPGVRENPLAVLTAIGDKSAAIAPHIAISKNQNDSPPLWMVQLLREVKDA